MLYLIKITFFKYFFNLPLKINLPYFLTRASAFFTFFLLSVFWSCANIILGWSVLWQWPLKIQEWWHMPPLSNPIPHLTPRNSMAKIIHVWFHQWLLIESFFPQNTSISDWWASTFSLSVSWFSLSTVIRSSLVGCAIKRGKDSNFISLSKASS